MLTELPAKRLVCACLLACACDPLSVIVAADPIGTELFVGSEPVDIPVVIRAQGRDLERGWHMAVGATANVLDVVSADTSDAGTVSDTSETGISISGAGWRVWGPDAHAPPPFVDLRDTATWNNGLWCEAFECTATYVVRFQARPVGTELQVDVSFTGGAGRDLAYLGCNNPELPSIELFLLPAGTGTGSPAQ